MSLHPSVKLVHCPAQYSVYSFAHMKHFIAWPYETCFIAWTYETCVSCMDTQIDKHLTRGEGGGHICPRTKTAINTDLVF